MSDDDVLTLILPGLWDSGPEHWQSHWERANPALTRRVVQADWETPARADWVAVLDRAVASADMPVVLAAHSTACLLVAHWAEQASPLQRARVRGALLVAPSDPEGPAYPAGPVGWAPVPLLPLPFPSILVSSTNDEYVTAAQAAAYARAWGSRLVEVGALGHVNGASGLGDWPAGRALLDELRRDPCAAPAPPPSA